MMLLLNIIAYGILIYFGWIASMIVGFALVAILGMILTNKNFWILLAIIMSIGIITTE